jgi:hypothetical protein
MVSSSQALQAREIFKQRFPKITAPGVSSNGDQGWKLVVRVTTEKQREAMPQEIEGVPLDVRIDVTTRQHDKKKK